MYMTDGWLNIVGNVPQHLHKDRPFLDLQPKSISYTKYYMQNNKRVFSEWDRGMCVFDT